MSCAYRTRRYRSSVTAHPASVSWNHVTGHPHHPISLHLPVMRPEQQAVTETEPPADDTPVSLSLVQYLCAQWQALPLGYQSTVAAILGELMRSSRWHWDVTVLPDQSLSDPQGSLVSSRDGRPTIGIPIAMLRELWRWVLNHIDERAAVLRWWAPTLDPALWHELRTHELANVPWLYGLYGYLSPILFPDIAHTTRHLLSSADPDDQQRALTILTRWMASPDGTTRTLAAQMLRAWLNQQAAASPTNDQRRPQNYRLRLRAITILASSDDPAVVSTRLYDLLRTEPPYWIAPDDVRTGIDLLHRLGDSRSLTMDRWMSLMAAIVKEHPSEGVIREVLDRLPTIVPPDRPADRVAWVTTLWTLVTDPTLSLWRRQTIAAALTPMMQDPMVGALVHAQLYTEPSLCQTLPTPICDTLLAGLMRTVCADEVLRMIEQEVRQNPNASTRFDPIVAAGWGHGRDHRILQIIDSIPGPHWREVLTQGITTSVGAAVCDRIGSWFPRDQALAMIVDHIHARERRGDWPLAPLPAYLIPWVGAAARACPYRLHPTTIRRLWLTDPDCAWNATQTMLHSDDSSVQQCAIAAMDAGWGRGHDGTLAATLRAFIPNSRNPAAVESGIATVVAGIGTAPPSIIAALLTELATSGNTDVQRRLISALYRGWGRGQDALVLRVVEIIAERDLSESIWDDAHETLIRAWDYLPPHVVVSLVDRLVTRATNRLAKAGPFSALSLWGVQRITAAFAPIWTHLPTPQVIQHIAHHMVHLHEHAHSISPSGRDTLVSVWASVVTAGAARLSASDIHALLSPLWDLSPYGCLDGIEQGVRR